MTEQDTAKTVTPVQQADHVHGQDHAHVHGPWCAHGHDHGHHHHGAHAPLVRTTLKIGRNDPCSCGSGKKHKKCCLA